MKRLRKLTYLFTASHRKEFSPGLKEAAQKPSMPSRYPQYMSLS
jgi:hypothetical protein